MKKTDKKIINYLEGELSSDELIQFENELRKSEELRERVQDLRRIIKLVENEKTSQISKDYTDQIIPVFRKKLNTDHSSSFIPRFALTLTIFIIAIISSILFFKADRVDQVLLTHDSLSGSEINDYLENYSYETYFLEYEDDQLKIIDSVYTNHFTQELHDSKNDIENLFAINNLEYDELESILSEEEIDFVYSEILNKEFF